MTTNELNPGRRTFMRGVGVATLAAASMIPTAEAADMKPSGTGVQRLSEAAFNKQRLPNDIIEGFRKLTDDLASVCDVLMRLGMYNCIEPGIKPLDPKSRLCGLARTMRLIPIQDPKNLTGIWEEQHPGSLINEAQPGDIIVIDQGGKLERCIWGGNTATAAKLFKLGGVVIDGAARDAAEILGTGVPHFVKGTTPQQAHGIWTTVNVMNEPVQIGAMAVAPGDLLVGNQDGIAVIPRLRAAEILKLAIERVALDVKVRGEMERREKLPWAPPPGGRKNPFASGS